MELVELIYAVTKELPADEKFGLVSQMRRSAVSIPSNIAEGSGRNSVNGFNHFLSIALSSSYELSTQLEIAFRVKFINEDAQQKSENLIYQLQSQILGLMNTLSKSELKEPELLYEME